MGSGYALNCVLHMLKILSRGREPEVEGDDSRVVVAVEKRERAIYLNRWRRRWRKLVNVVKVLSRQVTSLGSHIGHGVGQLC